MRGSRLLAIPISAALLSCSTSPSPTLTAADPTPTAVAAPSGSVDASSMAQSASDVLVCDGEVSSMGGRADEFGPDGSGATPDEALASWLQVAPFPVPRSGYDRVGVIGDRFVYAYSSDEEVKVVLVISPRFSEFVGGAPFTIEEMRTCDPSEYGATVDLGPGRRVWANEATGKILDDIAGPAHCGWESARMLHTSTDEGTVAQQYIRDPLGVFAGVPGFLDTYAEGVELPDDATFSGYRTADGLELWFTPADRAAYVVTPETVERWPRVDPPAGCM